MSKINPVNQEYLNALQKNIKARENMLAYQNQKYKEYLQTLYPNNTPIETILSKDYENYRKQEDEIKNLIMSSGVENYKQEAKQHLETLLSGSDAQKVLDELTDTELKHLNTLFPLMKTNLKSVKFYSIDEFITYIRTFIKQQINDDNESPTPVLQKKLDNQSFLQQLYKGVNDINTETTTSAFDRNYIETKTLIANMSKFLEKNQIVTQAQFQEDFARAFDTSKLNESTKFKSIQSFSPLLNKTKNSGKLSIPSGQQPIFYGELRREILRFFQGYFEKAEKAVKAEKAEKAGNGFKRNDKNRIINTPNPSRRLFRNKNIKIGNGVSHFIKHNFYIDMNAFNDNVLQIKYLKNGNKKMEIGMSDILKQNINEMMNYKYNPNLFLKLNEKEKKIVYAVNNIFQFVNEEMFVDNPVEKIWEKYQILLGQVEAGNDNPTIISNLKLVSQELYKLKKISKYQLKTLFFNLEGYN